MQLRDSQTGRIYVTFRIVPGGFPGASFSNDGSFLVASNTESVDVFRSESCLAVDDLIAAAKDRVLLFTMRQ